MTRLGVQPRHFEIPESTLRLVDLIPSRHLFLCQPPIKKLAVRLFTASPGSNNFSIGCSYRLILSCEDGVKVGHLLIALAKHHGAMRFGKQDAGSVFDDGYVVHVDLDDEEKFKSRAQFGLSWVNWMDRIEEQGLTFRVWEVTGTDTWDHSRGAGVTAASEREGLRGIGMGWMLDFIPGVYVHDLVGMYDRRLEYVPSEDEAFECGPPYGRHG